MEVVKNNDVLATEVKEENHHTIDKDDFLLKGKRKLKHPDENCDSDESSTFELSNFAFLLISFGYMLPWTSLGSLISYYKYNYSASFYVKLYCAYYLPGLPIAILQHNYDNLIDLKYGSHTAYLYRGLVAYSLTMIVIISMIWCRNEAVLIFLFVILGTCGWLCHGAATMLASMHTAAAIAYLQTGFRCPEIYALIAVEIFDIGRSPTEMHLKLFFVTTALFVFSGLFSWIYIVDTPKSIQCFDEKDHNVLTSELSHGYEESVPLLENDIEHSHKSKEDNRTPKKYTGYVRPLRKAQRFLKECESKIRQDTIFQDITPLCIALFLTIFSSIFQAAFFAYVESSSNRDIEQILYFVRLFCDFLGRPLTRLPRPAFIRVGSYL